MGQFKLSHKLLTKWIVKYGYINTIILKKIILDQTINFKQKQQQLKNYITILNIKNILT